MQNFCDAATATSPYKDWSTINRVWHLRFSGILTIVGKTVRRVDI
jgi:hypothetical protein